MTLSQVAVEPSYKAASPGRIFAATWGAFFLCAQARRLYDAQAGAPLEMTESSTVLNSSEVASGVARSSDTAIRTYGLIVFDLDGVIIDSVADIVAAARHCLHEIGSQDRSPALIRECIGGGARNLLLRCLDEDKKIHIDEAVMTFKTYYTQNCTKQTVLFPGVLDVLEYYAGKRKLALATFKLRSATIKILTELRVLRYFDVIVTADDVRLPKPDPECVNYILEALHCSRDAAIMVGDTPTDILTGKNAGIATCAVLYGIGTLEELKMCAPDFVIGNILELKKLITI
jgi:phosphoglycolate phosphatase